MSPGAPVARAPDAAWRACLLVIAGGTALRIAFGAWMPLVEDEAYYWIWSRRLAGGYFDHPPMIALAIRVGTLLLGDTPLGVRLGPIAAGTVAILAIAATARRMAGSGAAMLAASAMTAMPLVAAGLVLATPDAPMLGACAAAVYAVVRALEHAPRTRNSLRWWALAGWAIGLAFCSKYTSILLPVGAFIAMVWHPILRRRLAEPGPYVACLVATVVFLPVLIWNAQHDWVSFAFQLDHGLGRSTVGFWRGFIRHEGDLLGGQLALASPVLLVMMVMVVGTTLRSRARADEREYLLATMAATAFLFFVYSATRKRVEANWPAPAYVSAITLLAVRVFGARMQSWFRGGVTFAAVLSTIIYAHAAVPVLPIAPGRDPVGKAFGWDLVSAAVDRAVARPAPVGVTTWVAANRYQDAGQVAFHRGLEPDIFALNINGRRNQFDIWPGFTARARRGDRLVLVLDGTEPHPVVAALTPYFESILRGELVSMRRGDAEVSSRRVYTLDGWNGGWPPTR